MFTIGTRYAPGLIALGVLLGVTAAGLSIRVDPLARAAFDEKTPRKRPPDRREEEEESAPRTINRRVFRTGEDEEKAPLVRREIEGDLARGAAETKHPQVRALYRSLAVPYDEIALRSTVRVTIDGGRTLSGKIHVEPMPDYAARPTDLRANPTLNIIDDRGKRLATEKVGVGSIVSIRPYERIALDEVRDFLAQPFNRLPTEDPRYLSRYDQLVASETALAAVMRFHQSARERLVRKGDAWDAVETPLRDELLQVLLTQLDQLAESKAWDPAFALTRRLMETYVRPGDHTRIARPLAALLTKALSDPTFSQDRLREARLRLRQLEDRFPGSEVLRPISDSLRDQAKKLFERAQDLVKVKRQAEALGLLAQAEEIWPELPGLRAYRIQTDRSYQILRVGMRGLPRFLSPGWAVTEAEHRGVDLLFESLVDLTADESGLFSYRPGLATGRPRVVLLGRQFKLPRNARWSDGGELTVGDIRFTLQRLQEGRPGQRETAWRDQTTGRCTAWGDLLTKVQVGGDPFLVKLVLRQGFLDPLAAMSFKVLPRRSRPDPDSEAFALKPISSGPFVYAGRLSEPGLSREYAGFVANPHYGTRVDRLSLPRIREVRFYAPEDPVKELQQDRIDLALDLTAEQAASLREDVRFETPLPDEKTPNRRIWFLAVNNRKPGLSNPDLRVALARAINRESLLDDHFRKGLERKVHRAINGPYPARSWACLSSLVNRADRNSLDPHDADLARTKMRQALPKLGMREVRFTLKYPAGDRMLAAALADLCSQVTRTLPGVTLVPEERDPHALREDVEQTHSYDLAYYHHDFPDESLWLLPLLGPTGRGGGENYLGYNGSLVPRIQAATTVRHFSEVRKYAHDIHRAFLEAEMPFIPLWQLDALYSYRKGSIEMPTVEPTRLFARAEQWRVTRGR